MATSSIKIIAEGAILESLRQSLNGEAYEGGRLSKDDTLIVDVSANVNKPTARSAYGGLQTLERILSDPKKLFRGLVLVSFESREKVVAAKISCPCVELIESDSVPYIQLPYQVVEIPKRALEESARAISTPRTWFGWIYRLQASNRVLALTNSSYRHDHKNLIAALRIYLGALQIGDADLGTAALVLEALQSLERSADPSFSPSIKPDELLASCKNHRLLISRIASAKPPHSSEQKQYAAGLRLYEKAKSRPKAKLFAPSISILMVDDQYDVKGWKPVLDALIRKSDRIAYSNNFADAETILLDSNNHFDLMLLDCNLGKASSTGLELLPAIRSFTLDLPMVMTTAYDNAELALWALRAGCNGFFAKELEDSADRDSVDYYLMFSRNLRRLRWEKELRELWNDFRSRIPPNQELVEEESRIRYAFYLLFSLADGMTWWLRGAAHRLGSSDDTEEFIYRTVVLALYASENMRFAVEGSKGKRGNRARHLDTEITIEDALTALRSSISWFASRAARKTSFTMGQPAWPRGCRIPRTALVEDEDVAKASARLSKINLGHLERSRLGAVQLVLGFLAMQNVPVTELEDLFKEAPDDAEAALELLEDFCQQEGIARATSIGADARVVLIDDEGDINGWKKALEILLGSRIKWYRDLGSFLHSRTSLKRHADVILLDLWLRPPTNGNSSPKIGLETLDSLKKRDLGLPVVVISAATDTVNAIRCMKHGALDYVAKWLPTEEEPQSWRDFAKRLLDRIEIGVKLGRSSVRRIWGELAECLEVESPLLKNPTILTRIKNWSNPRSSAANIVDTIRSTFAEQLLPALILYHNKIVTEISNGEVPPLDAWRVKDVLQTFESVDENIIFLAGRAAEYLGMMRCGLEGGNVLTKDEWKQKLGLYSYWIKRASPKAGEVWKERSRLKDGATTGGVATNSTRILEKTIAALQEFEALAASQASAILRTR